MKEILNEWFVQAPWGKIALVSWGTAKGRRVLLVHGRQDSVATFLPLLQLLPNDFHYVALDLPGHGKSDPFPTGVMLTRIDFIIPIDIVVKHLRWKKFTYLAHSMGGELGLFYNAARPNLIIKFIFLDIGLALNLINYKPLSEYFEAYKSYYENYEKYNSDDRLYSVQRAVQSVMSAREVTASQAELLLARNLRPAPPAPPPAPAADTPHQEQEQLYTLSWDKRLKNLPSLNLPYDHYLYLFTTNVPPTLFIAPIKSAKTYENRNADKLMKEMVSCVGQCSCVRVEGGHDAHLTHAPLLAPHVAAALTAPTAPTSKL